MVLLGDAAWREHVARTQKFWFRKSVESEEDEVCEMSMDEIMRLDHVIRPESFKLHDLESGAGETMSYYNPYTPYTFVELCTSFAECR